MKTISDIMMTNAVMAIPGVGAGLSIYLIQAGWLVTGTALASISAFWLVNAGINCRIDLTRR